MKIIPLPAFQDNYIWMIVNDDNQCFCVDPGEAHPVLDYLNTNQISLTGILLTHHHSDHIGGVERLFSNFPNIVIYGPEDNRIPQVTHHVKEGNQITLFDEIFNVLAIPGHTSTHIAYYNSKRKLLFCGDTLFSAGCGRVFDGTMEKLFASLQKLNQLPSDTKIYCAHEYTLNNCLFAQTVDPQNSAILDKIKQLKTNPSMCSLPSDLATERQINPFIRAVNESLESQNQKPLSAFQRFKQLRELKDRF